MQVEILYFDGCPNHEQATRLVERLLGELEIEAEIQLVPVPDPETAERLAFLGSPTIRVDGRDVEAGADERRGGVLACRVYPTAAGPSGIPDEQWVSEALTGRRISAG